MTRLVIPMAACAVLIAAACKTDVGPKRKVVSDELTARKGTLWKKAHVLALRRVKKGTYMGKGALPGLSKWQRGYMRYHLVLTGGKAEQRVFLYEARYRHEEGKGKGADKLLLRGSANDRCVAYSNDGGKRWRLVRLLDGGVPINFPRPVIEAEGKAADPCAGAPPLKEHILAQLADPERSLNCDHLEGFLRLLGLLSKDVAYHAAFARFLLTEGRRQYFYASLAAPWRPVQALACRNKTLRDIYLKTLSLHRLLGKRPLSNAVLVLETCNRADVQDRLAGLLRAKPTDRGVNDMSEIARALARITAQRKVASRTTRAAVIAALPTAAPRVQVYLAHALGSLGGADAHAALRKLLEGGDAAKPPAKAAPTSERLTVDELGKRMKVSSTDMRKRLVLQVARAGLDR